jgi:hypothetical protein
MRNFLLRLAFFLIVLVISFSVIAHFLIRENNTFSKRLIWYYVYERIIRSNSIIKSDTLILGDSVGNQFFPFDKNENALATNAGVLMTGQYILAANALECNPEIKAIKMVMVPNSLGWNFERTTSFNNFCKPFLSLENQKYFSPLVYNKLNLNPLSYLAYFDFAKMLTFFQLDLNDSSKVNDEKLSDISMEYLVKLIQLCNSKNIDIRFVSPPVPERRLISSENWKVIRRQLTDLGCLQLFGNYFDNIQYLPETYFRDDIHLTPDYLNAHRNEIIQNYLK